MLEDIRAAWPTADEMALDELRRAWDGIYDVGYADGAYRAVWLLGGPLLTAGTPEALDSAIRADFSRGARRQFWQDALAAEHSR